MSNDTFEANANVNVNNTTDVEYYDSIVRHKKDKKGNLTRETEPVKLTEAIEPGNSLNFMPATFNTVDRRMVISRYSLCHQIKESFATVFHDLSGVNVYAPYDTRGRFNVIFYFEENTDPLPKGKIRALHSLLRSEDNNDAYQTMNNVYKRLNGQYYEFTDEAKILLAELMPGGVGRNSVNSKNWNEYVEFETYKDNTGYYAGPHPIHISVKLNAIDIYAVLRKVYGNCMPLKTENQIGSDGKVESINWNGQKAIYDIELIGWDQNTRFCNDPKSNYYVRIRQYDADDITSKFAMKHPTYSDVPYFT